MATRIPRPVGLTSLSQNKENQLNKGRTIRKQVLLHYVQNNNTYCNEYLTFEQLAYFLNITINQLTKEYVQLTKQLGRYFGTQEMLSSALQQSFSMAQNRSLRIQGLIHQQLGLMLKSQGDTYKAFVTAEYHKLLDTAIKANKSDTELVISIANFIKQGQRGILVNPTSDQTSDQGTQQVPQKGTLTLEMAHQILAESVATSLQPGDLNAKLIELTDEVPIIDARAQPVDRHDIRRENEEGADIEPPSSL